MVGATVLALACAATVNAGNTKGNPFKPKPKTPPPKKHKPVCKPIKPKPKTQPTPTTFSGRAIGVDLTNSTLGVHWVVGDTGPLPSAGGTVDLSVTATNLQNIVTIGMVHAATTGGGAQSSSQVQVQNFSALFVHTDYTNSVSFTFAGATASANCTSNGAALSASTEIQGLVVNGVSITPSGETNQIIVVPGGTIVLNAQLTSGTGNVGDINAAAIFFDFRDCFSGVIAYAKADISCGIVPPGGGGGSGGETACGKLTGGGFIVGTPSGDHGSFGVSGGIRRGEFWGHLNYIDHGTGMHVTSTAVTGFSVIDAVTRQIDYNVNIDGVPGTARVICADLGEPGRDDIFDITLSTGYHAGGDLGGAGHGGGNIQLHKCPPGWAK